ncbi:MAG TPA: hypothetical protein VJY41_12170 [Prolixibacteraceae bacterium]|nr:hypothetical protein [Prolixibacteraceae bacterium]
MIKDWINTIKKEFKSFNLKKNNRPVIFIICVLIASALWLVSAMGKRYETTVSIPIQYTNLPTNKVLINKPPSKINVKMEAFGSTLLRHKIQLSINPINFNINQFTNKVMEKSNDTTFVIDLQKYIPQISKQVSSEITIIDILPEQIEFKFDKVITVKKAIKHNLTLSFEPQFFLLDSVKFTPDSVSVCGPKSIVDTINMVCTKPKIYRELNASVKNSKIQLQSIPGVSIVPNKVAVEIPVSFYTEFSDHLQLIKYNVPDSINLITFPSQINVKCLVAIDQYSNLNSTSFIIGIDYNNLNINTNKFPIQVHRSPTYIKSISINPTEVEYLIQKKRDD